MKVAVVILNWNGKKHLEQFLPFLMQHSKGAEIILADNHSSDESVRFVSEKYPEISIIRNDKNHGFAGGYNAALKSVQADIFVLLNSDVEVTENWLEPVLDRLKSPNIAACQPKVLSLLDKSRFEHAGAAGGFIDKDGYPFCRGRMFETAELDQGQYDEAVPIFWATGACLFIKSDVFFSAGGFDDRFFAHMEEIDLCWRIKHMGYEIWVEPQSKVYHLGGGTLNYMSPRKTFLNFRNNLFMIHKNHPGPIGLKMLRRLAIDGIAAMKFLFGLQFRHFWQVFKAHIHYYKNISKLNADRKHIKQASKVKHVSGIYSQSIVWSYFIRKIKSFSDLKWQKP